MKWKIFKNFFNLPDNVDEIRKDIADLKEGHQEIREALIAKGFIKPFARSESPKQITDRGYDLLNKNNVNEFLLSTCELLKEDKINKLKDRKEVEVFYECLQWVKNHGMRKVIEIMYNSNISENECIELLALAIRDKIFNN